MTTYPLSIVIPAYNEEDCIGIVLERAASVLDSVGGGEIVVVDDGSADATARIVEEFILRDGRVRLVQFSRNFGHQCAVSAGLAEVRGEHVAVIDADLQDPPELLPEMLRIARNDGYDVVYGIRAKRQESLLQRIGYWGHYRLLSLTGERETPLDAGDFAVMSSRVVAHMNALPERRRYVRGLRSWVGFRQTGLRYARPSRELGTAKYGIRQLTRLAVTGILASSRAPLLLSVWLGFGVGLLGFAWAGKVVVWKLLFDTAPDGFSAIIVAVLCVGGAQLFSIGVLGHYLGRVLDQVEARPHYIVHRRVNPAKSEDTDA